MANRVVIQQNIGGTTANYQLSGATDVPYTGVGTPWVDANTTPIRLGMNDVTGPPWTPRAPQPQTILSGGPPFVNGSNLVTRSYPTARR